MEKVDAEKVITYFQKACKEAKITDERSEIGCLADTVWEAAGMAKLNG